MVITLNTTDVCLISQTFLGWLISQSGVLSSTHRVKGKPIERSGRKATGLRVIMPKTAEPPSEKIDVVVYVHLLHIALPFSYHPVTKRTLKWKLNTSSPAYLVNPHCQSVLRCLLAHRWCQWQHLHTMALSLSVEPSMRPHAIFLTAAWPAIQAPASRAWLWINCGKVVKPISSATPSAIKLLIVAAWPLWLSAISEGPSRH